MTLTTHILIAAAATKPIATMHPAVLFAVAVVSHYLSDLIPHWDYRMTSLVEGGRPGREHWAPRGHSLRNDLLRGGSDMLLGALLALILMRVTPDFSWWWYAAAVIGGVAPDALKALYKLFGEPQWLKPAEAADTALHTNIRLGPYPLIGIPLQIAILAIAIIMVV